MLASRNYLYTQSLHQIRIIFALNHCLGTYSCNFQNIIEYNNYVRVDGVLPYPIIHQRVGSASNCFNVFEIFEDVDSSTRMVVAKQLLEVDVCDSICNTNAMFVHN